MSYEEKKGQLADWLDMKGRGGERFRFTEKDGRGSVIFCTGVHTYHLSFTDSYLGCTASCRTQRPGENWTRGSDLPDGGFSRDTFDEIIRAIVAYELVDLDPVVKSAPTPAVVGPAL